MISELDPYLNMTYEEITTNNTDLERNEPLYLMFILFSDESEGAKYLISPYRIRFKTRTRNKILYIQELELKQKLRKSARGLCYLITHQNKQRRGKTKATSKSSHKYIILFLFYTIQISLPVSYD